MFELAYASPNVVQTVCLKLKYIADAESSWICGDPKSLAGEFTVDAGNVVPLVFAWFCTAILFILADGKWHEDADGVPFSSRVICLIAKRVWCEPDMKLTAFQLVWTIMVVRALSPIVS